MRCDGWTLRDWPLRVQPTPSSKKRAAASSKAKRGPAKVDFCLTHALAIGLASSCQWYVLLAEEEGRDDVGGRGRQGRRGQRGRGGRLSCLNNESYWSG